MPRKSNDKQAVPAPAGLHRKPPQPDLYTVFLAIALVAVLLGILFLFLEMQLYEFKIQGAPPVGMVSVQQPAFGSRHLADGCPFSIGHGFIPRQGNTLGAG